jgi:hypothetical protein
MTCRVTFVSTPRDHSVHIEALDHPDDLLYAAEDERAAPVYHHALDFFREHREHTVGAIEQRFGPLVNYARRYRIMRWLYWLLRVVTTIEIGEHYKKEGGPWRL